MINVQYTGFDWNAKAFIDYEKRMFLEHGEHYVKEIRPVPYTYILQSATHPDIYKIGRTINLYQRLGNLRTQKNNYWDYYYEFNLQYVAHTYQDVEQRILRQYSKFQYLPNNPQHGNPKELLKLTQQQVMTILYEYNFERSSTLPEKYICECLIDKWTSCKNEEIEKVLNPVEKQYHKH